MSDPWKKQPSILQGESVDLIALEKKHFEELFLVASEKKIWEFFPIDCSIEEKFMAAFNDALKERERGNHFPFVIFNKKENKLIGSTRLFDINEKNKKIEIGWTWLHPRYWASEINAECKLLLLTYCFEVLKARRVQLKTSDNNLRSRKAIEKIGGKFEGILRKDLIRDDGASRNSAYYSIIDTEWEEVKLGLAKRLGRNYNL